MYFRVIIQIARYLETKLAGRGKGWKGNPVLYVNLLEQGQTECGCFYLCQFVQELLHHYFLLKGTESLPLVPAWDSHIHSSIALRISGETPSSSNVFIKSLYIFYFGCKDREKNE